MGLFDFIKGNNVGRRRKMPERETIAFPTLSRIMPRTSNSRYLYKPTPRNLRYFSHQPFARRAINAIKNPISMLDWKVVPIDGVDLNSELERQIEVVTNCLRHPNADDSFQTLIEQVIEDYLIGAAAVETQVSGDKLRPLWLFPVDGLSIQMYPGWNGEKNEPRYAQVIGYGTAFGGGRVCELTNDELIYVRPNPSTQTPFGFGPLEIAFNTINSLLGVSDFAGNVASNSRPSIWIDAGEGMTQADLNTLRQYFINEVEGQGVTPITSLGGSTRSDEKSKRGLAIHRLYPEGDNGLYLLYQNFLIRTLGASFDLSPQNFGLEADVNRNTSEVAEDRDWNQAIKPCAFKLQEHITREAIHNRLGFSQLRFQFAGLDREDEGLNAEIYEREYKNNAITPNEYRAVRGKPPMDNEWGDMTSADVQIAMNAARGAKDVLDDNLTGGAKRRSKPKGKDSDD
jgi:hypothetical protein